MENFKSRIKRLRVTNAPATVADAPFAVLARDPVSGNGEVWTVRGWEPDMVAYFERVEASLREVIDLDLEEGFVELLRTFRAPQA